MCFFYSNSGTSQTVNVVKIDTLSGAPGDVVCLSVTVDSFYEMFGLTFSLNWDTAVIKFSSVQMLNTTLGLSQLGNFGLPTSPNIPDTALTFSWDFFNTIGTTLPRGTLLFKVCFTVVGVPGTMSTVRVTNFPSVKGASIYDPSVPIGVSEIGVTGNTGKVNVVQGATQPLELAASTQNAQPADVVCVDVRAKKFIDINSMMFSLHFDPSIITYSFLNNFQAALLARGFGVVSFNTSQAAAGILTVNWTSSAGGVTLPDGATIFSICFNAVGAIGTFSDIKIDGTPLPVKVTNGTSNGVNIGLTSTPGRVNIISTVLQPTIKVGSSTTEVGDPTCIDFTVQNFSLISELQFSVSYDPSKLRFDSTSAYNLPGLAAADFTVNAADRKSTRLNSSHSTLSRMPCSA